MQDPWNRTHISKVTTPGLRAKRQQCHNATPEHSGASTQRSDDHLHPQNVDRPVQYQHEQHHKSGQHEAQQWEHNQAFPPAHVPEPCQKKARKDGNQLTQDSEERSRRTHSPTEHPLPRAGCSIASGLCAYL